MVTAHRRGGGIENVRQQQVDGIDIISLGGWYSNDLSARRRMFEFARFTVLSTLLRELPYRPDVVIASSTPLTIGIPGAQLSNRFSVPFVFEVRDLWPQAPVELGVLRDPVTIGLARRLERWLYNRADRIIALSPGMAEGIRAAGGDERRITTIPNASDTDLFSPEQRDRSLLERWGLQDKFVAAHAGAMGKANGLQYLVEAARQLQARQRHDIHILLAGFGGTRPQLEEFVQEHELRNVTFAGSLPREQLGPLVSSVDACITSFAPYPVLATNSPNKLFDGLAAGVPNIVNSPGWTRELVLDNDVGAYVDPKRPHELADALVRLADNPQRAAAQGAAARRLALEQFDRSILAQRFEDVLLDAVGAPKRTAAVAASG